MVSFLIPDHNKRLKRISMAGLAVSLLLIDRLNLFTVDGVRRADIFIPLLLLIAIGSITVIYAIVKSISIARKPKAAPVEKNTKNKLSSNDYSKTVKIDYKDKSTGIGTGVIKIFQQIKDSLDDVQTLSDGYSHLLNLSCEQLEFDAAAAFIINPKGEMKICGHCGIKLRSREDYIISGTGKVSEIFETGFPRFLTNPSRIEGNCQKLFENFEAAWLLPLMPQGTPAGVLVFLHKEPPSLNEYYYPKLDFVGIAASWFYENHNNQILISKENKRNEMLLKTSLAISSSLDLDEVCNILTAKLGDYFGCSYSYILLSQGDTGKMYMQKFYSNRGGLTVSPEERIVDIEAMSWLQEIISLETPFLLEEKDLELYPEDDLIALKLFGCSDALIAPLKRAGKLTGILMMIEQRTEDRSALNRDVVDLSAALVAQAAAAIENASMYSMIKDKVSQLTTMIDVGQALNSDLDLIPFYNKVLDAISANFNISNCSFMLRDFDTDELYVVTTIGDYPEYQLGRRFRIGKEGITGYTAAQKETINVGDVSKDKRFIVSTGKTGSEMAVPVILHGNVVGILDVESSEKFAFLKREQDLLESLMDQVAAAMEKIRLKQVERERAAKLALTNSLVKKLSGILNRSELLSEAVKSLSEGFGFDLVAVFIPDRDEKLRLAQQCCRWGQGYEPGLTFSTDKGTLSNVFKQWKSYYQNDISPEESDDKIKGIKSRYSLPLVAGRNFHGVLDIQDRRPKAFSQIDLTTLQTIAEFLAVTLNNISLYSETVDTAERLSLVDQIIQAISATLDLEELFNQIVKSLSEITGYNWATLVFKEDQKYHAQSDYFKKHKDAIGEMPDIYNLEKYFEEVVKQSKPVYFNINEMSLTDSLHKYFYDQDINYIAISPLEHENKHIGFLLVGNPNPEGFRPQDNSLLYDVSQHLEIAISNAILYSELKKAYDRLAETQEKLIQTEKFKALGEVSAGIAHDFKNILAAIVGRVQLLTAAKDRGKDISEKVLFKNLEIIEKSADDGVHILSRINEFTKGKSENKFTEIRLGEIIEDTVEMTRPKWEDIQNDRTIKVKTRLTGDLCITGNRSEMVRVISNLILNAVDAISGDGNINIDAFIEAEYVILRVGDDGIGMDADTVKRIFDPYYTTKGRLGTGLGLAMVYAIINRHNGEITVESEPGIGTVFTIKLPAVIDSTAVTKASVLIVEDDDNLRNVLYDITKSMCDKVMLAGDHAQASDLLSKHSFDLVITDLGLPDRDGWKIIDIVKSASPDCKIVPMTGWNKEIKKQDLVSRGLTQILKKPFSMEQVKDLISQVNVRKVDAGKIA